MFVVHLPARHQNIHPDAAESWVPLWSVLSLSFPRPRADTQAQYKYSP